jgi:hypothetical protein
MLLKQQQLQQQPYNHPACCYIGSCLPCMCRSSSDDNGDVVPRGRLLEDYHRLALHTLHKLSGEWVASKLVPVVTDTLAMRDVPLGGLPQAGSAQ